MSSRVSPNGSTRHQSFVAFCTHDRQDALAGPRPSSRTQSPFFGKPILQFFPALHPAGLNGKRAVRSIRKSYRSAKDTNLRCSIALNTESTRGSNVRSHE